eukprot:CAMPEP_0201517192 /NCGR_PEP_ID=MMETSP0161_2-20130828/8356_1 /ASSEMBLY_ACC=CAM_ASM_000251 /TAXON_ID=180227 /ORGANISM="Neoparamoeba aestuarina, Strain SoJaBio B1-5/56/2" /LENGTH=486 /DNA_ID=CAMNT_0047914613 /DNA_START=38 /DNA_END=1498 /DNA_ORIENTATION=+
MAIKGNAMTHNFLSEPELMRLGRHKTKKYEKVTERWFSPLLLWVAKKTIPVHVAPNVLSLAGLLCVIQAFYLCEVYSQNLAHLSLTVLASLLVFANFFLHRMDPCHAKNIRNDSVLGDLFSDACGNVGTIFNCLVLCTITGLTDPDSQWYIVQMTQLGLLRHHVKAFKSSNLPTLIGPDAAFFWFGAIALLSLFVDTYWIVYVKSVLQISSFLAFTYWTVLIFSILEALSLPFSSRNGVILCLIYSSMPAILYNLGLQGDESLIDVFCDGMFMSMLTTDMIVGRKAERDFHPWLVLFAMASLVNNFVCLFLVVFYYISLFYEISQFLNLPLFTSVINVYCDGVYDLCHLGHKNAFQNALQFGNRLFVGVMSDEDCASYKRKPIMTTQERCEAVAACKCVYSVIPGAPCFGMTKEFIEKHNLHVIAHGEEYEKPDDIYYKVPRAMGITRILPRTHGMSTSELIRRVCRYNEEKLRDEGLLKEKQGEK